MYHTTSSYSLFLGDKTTSIIPDTLRNFTPQTVLTMQPFKEISLRMALTALVLQHQVHGTAGRTITADDPLLTAPLLSVDGDFLITTKQNIGIGIVTADCVPIIFFDPHTPAVGIAHAGWKGTTANIALTMLQTLETTYGTRKETVQVFFGPCAQVCCYEVDAPFYDHLCHNSIAQKAFVHRNNKLFFNLIQYNVELLSAYGIPPQSLTIPTTCCTICTANQCSHRKSQGAPDRQLTVISLK